MTSGLISVSFDEAGGLSAVSADIDQLAVVIGPSSVADPTLFQPSPFYLSGKAAAAALGFGDAVDTTCQAIEQQQPTGGTANKKPVAMFVVANDNPGTYDTIDTSGVTGTAIVTVDAGTDPYGTYDGYLRVKTGGLIGTDGIELVDSLDDGRHVSRTVKLSTATSYTIARGNVKFNFNPTTSDLTALNTLINDIFDKLNAHAGTTASVHGIADTADEVNGTTYPAPSLAGDTTKRVNRLNACRAAYELHRVKISGGVHGAADTTNVMTLPSATDDSSALTLAIQLAAKLDAHEQLVGSNHVHGVADTNLVTAPTPSAGSLNAGDIIRVHTRGPTVASDDVADAFAKLAASTIDFSLVFCDFATNAAMLTTISTGRAALRAAGKICSIICRARDRSYHETEAAWMASIAADFHAYNDDSVFVCAGYLLVTDSMTSNQYLRNQFQQFAADVVRVKRSIMMDMPGDDMAQPNVTLINAAGATIGHDEGPRGSATGLSNADLGNRFICSQRIASQKRREDVFTTVPWSLFAADGRIRNLPTRRICNAMEREAINAGVEKLGKKLSYNKATETTPATLTESSRRIAHAAVFAAMAQFDGDIDNASDGALDDGLVQIDSRVTPTQGNLLNLTGTLAPSIGGYVVSIDFTLAVQE